MILAAFGSALIRTFEEGDSGSTESGESDGKKWKDRRYLWALA
jgi:hypothetical protein